MNVVHTSCNVRCSSSGKVSLIDSNRHGFVVFAPVSMSRFEVRMTALHDDGWPDKAGSYCLGIIHEDEVERLGPSYGPDFVHLDSMFMHGTTPRMYSVSSGSFRASRNLFDVDAWSLWPGSLDMNGVMSMRWENGTLQYRLASHDDFTDLTRYVVDEFIPEDPSTAGDSSAPPRTLGPTYLPVLWLFAHEYPDTRRQYYYNLYIQPDVQVQCSTPHPETVDPVRRKMWEEMLFPDCTIACGDKLFRAHRCMLVAASPVFRAAFVGEMQEAQDGRFEVGDCDSPEAVKLVLEFAYTGVLADVEVSIMHSLLPLAVQYELEDLCLVIAERLITDVSVSNVGATLNLLRTFRESRCLHDAYACLLRLVRSDFQLLEAATLGASQCT